MIVVHFVKVVKYSLFMAKFQNNLSWHFWLANPYFVKLQIKHIVICDADIRRSSAGGLTKTFSETCFFRPEKFSLTWNWREWTFFFYKSWKSAQVSATWKFASNRTCKNIRFKKCINFLFYPFKTN